MQRRWTKLYKDVRLVKNQQYDISKIPDVYDCIKYDLMHNNKILRFQEAEELHHLAKCMADVVIPQVGFQQHCTIYYIFLQIDHISLQSINRDLYLTHFDSSHFS